MKIGMFGGKFLPLHMGHVYAMTKAACMVDTLYVVLSYSKERDKKLCEEGKIKEIPYSVRLQWLKALAKDMPNVKVVAVEDYASDNESYDWAEGAEKIKNSIPEEINVVFSSENEYTEIFSVLYPNAKHVIIDENRSHYPISATKIRQEGVYKNWGFIPKVARPFFIKKVALVGTESCGKSTLTESLARIFQTNFVSEYGRTVCEEIGGYEEIITEEHYKEIVFGHKYFEYQKTKESNKILFIDSEAVVSQYYAFMSMGQEYKWLEGAVDVQNYDLYLFLEPDVKWVADGIRSYGEEELRRKNNEILKAMFRQRNIPFAIVKGDYLERFETAEQLIEQLIA